MQPYRFHAAHPRYDRTASVTNTDWTAAVEKEGTSIGGVLLFRANDLALGQARHGPPVLSDVNFPDTLNSIRLFRAYASAVFPR